jgi:hypothetical protein
MLVDVRAEYARHNAGRDFPRKRFVAPKRPGG